ncbi:hypothetical protein [Reyranella sp.]|uniref:hypothetical protein n=1 Tax=Reyranella sp. TaxID=1929291 RepID=UPI00272F5512|nr:hypothetical protein [Reyranella sp.]MDP2372451.1 hypothetical protein [Reyranella sp.]
MAHVRSVTGVTAHILKPDKLPGFISIMALGDVPTTGWTHIRLSPWFYIVPPADGMWDFDMIGDEPMGFVGQVILPVSAHTVVPAPDWCKGVRIHAATNKIAARLESLPVTTAEFREPKAAGKGNVIVRRNLASYDDSIQPTGATRFDPWPHFEMKKLHHNLVLIVEGPDEAHILDCINKAIAAGLLAAIVAACATLGAALPAAISAFMKALGLCLGAGFTVKVEDQSHWVYWWT